jgi:hypothetical protein
MWWRAAAFALKATAEKISLGTFTNHRVIGGLINAITLGYVLKKSNETSCQISLGNGNVQVTPGACPPTAVTPPPPPPVTLPPEPVAQAPACEIKIGSMDAGQGTRKPFFELKTQMPAAECSKIVTEQAQLYGDMMTRCMKNPRGCPHVFSH